MEIVKSVRGVKYKIALVLFLALFWPLGAIAGDKELVMFGTSSCVYCQIFKREVAPNYRWSKAARQVPLKEINIDRRGTGGYSLRTGITVTPTFVMFKRGREVSRIRGYPGEKNFYRMVNRMLKKVR